MKIRMSQKDVKDAMQLWLDANMTKEQTVASVRAEAGTTSNIVQDIYVFVEEAQDDRPL